MRSCKQELINITISETKSWKHQMKLKLQLVHFTLKELFQAQADGRLWMTIIKTKFQLMPMFQELWFISQLKLLNQQDLEKSKLWLLHKEIKQKLTLNLLLQKQRQKNLLSNKSSIKMVPSISSITPLQLQPWPNQYQTKRPLKQQNHLFLLMSSKLSKTRLLNKMTVSFPRVRMN